MKKFTELKDQSDEQLDFRLKEIESELFSLYNELAMTHKLEKPHLIKANKKERAQILTLLTQRGA